MLTLKRLLWTYLSEEPTLLVKVGDADHVVMEQQPQTVESPTVTIRQADDNKMIREVHGVDRYDFVVIAWSIEGDEECDTIADVLYGILDGLVPSDDDVFIYDSSVRNMVGPYFDEPAKAWRKDVFLEIIAREK